MKTPSRSTQTALRARIARRRRASAQDWGRHHRSQAADRLNAAELRSWPPQRKQPRDERSELDELVPTRRETAE